jgi:hypothetical protein
MHWQYFERTGFNIFDLLLSLSIEYQNQMHIDAEEDNYLLRRITERFFIPSHRQVKSKVTKNS